MKAVYLVIKIFILLVFLVLALNNSQVVQFFYLPGNELSLPLIVLLFGGFVVGVVFGVLAMVGRLVLLRGENGRLRREVRKYARFSRQDEVDDMKI